MFDEESEEPLPKKLVTPVAMEPLSIKELHELIAHFEAEIGRAREEIDRKQNLRGSAEALFNK